MATRAEKVRNLVLLRWAHLANEEGLKSASRTQWYWVVDSPRSLPEWYATVLGNLTSRHVRGEPATIDAVRAILHAGLAKAAFERLKQAAAVSSEDLGRAISVPPRTLARRQRFRQDESERLLRVASAFQRTLDVFGNLDKARRWFSAPARALGGKTPLEFCDTGPGAEEVEHLLGRIEHGVVS